MAKDDPKSGATDKSGAGKPSRRPPPTLDLSARDLTPAEAKAEKPAKVTPVSDEAATTEPLAPAEAIAEAPPEPANTSTPTTSGEVPVLDAEAPATAGAGGSDEPPAEPVRPAQAPEAGPVPPAGKRPARQLGLIGGLAVALVSGVLGAAVAFAIVGTFTSAEENADAITELEARALDLRQRVETLEAAGGQPTPGLDTVPAELAARLDALESGLDALGKKVDSQPAPVAPAADASATPAASAEAVAALGSRVGAVEDRLSSLPAPAPAATPDDVAAANARIGALESKVAALPAPAPSVSPDDLAAATGRISALEQKLATVASAQQASGQGAAQLVALSALRDAVLGARPFTTELKAARALLGTEGAPLAALEPMAAEGFPDGPSLAAELKRAVAPPPPSPAHAGVPTDEGVLDRLLRGAQGLVTVRRLDATGTPPGVSEAQAALERGDFAAAHEALATLSEADRAKVQPVAQTLEARQAALDAIAGLNQHVLASLAGGAQ